MCHRNSDVTSTSTVSKTIPVHKKGVFRLLNKNKKVMSLVLGLAMVYGVGAMSVYASPQTELPATNPPAQEQQCPNPNHSNDPNCKKHHKHSDKCKLEDKKPSPPKKQDNDKKSSTCSKNKVNNIAN